MRPWYLWMLLAEANGAPLLALRARQQNQLYLAIQEYRKAIDHSPDDPSLFLGIGVVEVRASLFADGLVDLQLGQTDPFYEQDGLALHADALQAFGYGEEAANLRFSGTWAATDAEAVVLFADRVTDYRVLGDWEKAEDAWLEAYARFPQSPLVLAEGALLYSDLGDLEEARFYSDLAMTSDVLPKRAFTAQVWLDMQQGKAKNAESTIADLRKDNPLGLEALLLKAEYHCWKGELDDAWNILDGPRWRRSERPEVLVLRSELLRRRGETAEGKRILQRAQELYPRHPWVRDTLPPYR